MDVPGSSAKSSPWEHLYERNMSSFKDMFLFDYLKKLRISFSKILVSSLIHICLLSLVSSAKLPADEPSRQYTRDRIGPRTDPWRTPLRTSLRNE